MLKKNVVPSLKLPSSFGPPQKVIATARSKRITERQSRKKLAEDTVMESLQTGKSESDQEDSQLAADTDVTPTVMESSQTENSDSDIESSQLVTGQTVKYIVGVTPAGTSNYISPGYPGRASNKIHFQSRKCNRPFERQRCCYDG
jgi:hypothetical protein